MVTLTEYNKTITHNDWRIITDAINYLCGADTTLAEIEQVANNFKAHHSPTTFEIFIQELWAMIGYLTAKNYK